MGIEARALNWFPPVAAAYTKMAVSRTQEVGCARKLKTDESSCRYRPSHARFLRAWEALTNQSIWLCLIGFIVVVEVLARYSTVRVQEI